MTNLTTLPLVVLASMGLAACGGDDADVDDVDTTRTSSTYGDTDDSQMADMDRTTTADRTMDGDMDMDMDGDMDGDMDMDDGMMSDDMMGQRVSVAVTNVEPNGGDVYVTLQTQDSFPNGASEYGQMVEATADRVTVTFEDVETGAYVAAAFQDTDGNGSLAMGSPAPTEPWGFSGYSGGAPDWTALMFPVEDTGSSLEIELNR